MSAVRFHGQIEETLDDISGRRIDWKTVFATESATTFLCRIEGHAELRVRSVLDRARRGIGRIFFRRAKTAPNPGPCPPVQKDGSGLRPGRHGPFCRLLELSDCKYTRKLAVDGRLRRDRRTRQRPQGTGPFDPETSKDVTLRKGPYAFFMWSAGVTKAKAAADKAESGVRIPDGINAGLKFDLELALSLAGRCPAIVGAASQKMA